MTAFVGMGKTAMGIFAIRRVLNAMPEASVLVIAPSQPVMKSWKAELTKCTTAFEHVDVATVDKAARDWATMPMYDLLVIDEIHQVPTPKRVGCLKIRHKMVLGLTATFERLDERHKLVEKVAPVVDRITLAEGVRNGWTSRHATYVVMCDIEDLNKYNAMTNEFKRLFKKFGYDFQLPFNLLKSNDVRLEYINNIAMPAIQEKNGWDDYYVYRHRADIFKEAYKSAMADSRAFIKTMTDRKNFIYHHPKKLEVAERIINARKGCKTITFWETIEDAERVEEGRTYASPSPENKYTEKTNRETLDWFEKTPGAVINTVRALNLGFNCPEITLGIMAGFNSSGTSATQRKGRVIRVDKMFSGKQAEVYYIVLAQTKDEHWAEKALKGTDYVLIGEKDLDRFLRGEEIDFIEGKLAEGGRY